MEIAQWLLVLGVSGWIIYRALKRPPPVSRWARFAETHGLRHSPSTPFARAQLSGLWREGASGAPVPIMIQVLRRTHTRSEGLAIWTQVPGGLPHGFQIGPEIADDDLTPSRCNGVRATVLAQHIRTEGLQKPLQRFFEDWPEATIENGALYLTLMGSGQDPLQPIEAMVEICRRLSPSHSGKPEDLVVATIPLGDPNLPGSLPAETIDAEAKAYHEGSKDTLSLPDFTPFGSPFGLRAPDMAPPGEGVDIVTNPMESPGSNEAGDRLLRQLHSLTQSTQRQEQLGLLAELEQQTLHFQQKCDHIVLSDSPFLPKVYQKGQTTVGKLIGLDLIAEIRHPAGAVCEGDPGPWRLQLIDWDPTESRLITLRLMDVPS